MECMEGAGSGEVGERGGGQAGKHRQEAPIWICQLYCGCNWLHDRVPSSRLWTGHFLSFLQSLRKEQRLVRIMAWWHPSQFFLTSSEFKSKGINRGQTGFPSVVGAPYHHSMLQQSTLRINNTGHYIIVSTYHVLPPDRNMSCKAP